MLLKALFRRLCEAYLRAFRDNPDSLQPKLILVLGPNDPSLGPRGVLPRAPLPANLFEEVPNVERNGEYGEFILPHWLHLASNPVRLRLYTREVVVFRYDYSHQLLRHCIHLSTSTANNSEVSLVKLSNN